MTFMWYARQNRPGAGELQACAGLALACAYSSSDEFEAELIHARRKAGAYGPRRYRLLVLAVAAAAAGIASRHVVRRLTGRVRSAIDRRWGPIFKARPHW
jgi:hypothetical protein